MADGILWCPHCKSAHRLGTKICPVTAKTIERDVHNPSVKARKHPLIGVVLGGKYRVERLIGRGGMSEVFEAENTLLSRAVAIKVVANAASPDAVSRLQREAQLVAAIQHPNICDVYDVGTLPDGAPFVVLERLAGETLDVYLRTSGPLSTAAVVDVFMQVLSGLQAAHGTNIVHRDLKPKNVFLVDRLGCAPIVKLLDFGFAKNLKDARGRPLTLPGTALGTVPYMAPEQLRGESATKQSDLFAVAIMIYEALTGRHPFAGNGLVELRANLLRCEPRPVRELRPDLPAPVEELVGRALAKEPGARWSTALEFQRELARALTLRAPSNVPEPSPPSGTVRPFDD